jgi:O-antigen/teichoic acid export membrane protein/peptidoglycan/xylan/chitin deacetylase (PgdA/CDA1 family)
VKHVRGAAAGCAWSAYYGVRLVIAACFYYSGLVPFLRWGLRRSGPRLIILNYHRANGNLRRHLVYLRKHYRIIPLESALHELYTSADDRPPQSDKRTPLAITFDDSYYDNYTCASMLARELRIPISIFVIPGYVESGSAFHWLEGEYLVQHAQVATATIAERTYYLDQPGERKALARAIDARVRYAQSMTEWEDFLTSVRCALGTPVGGPHEDTQARSISWSDAQEMARSGWVTFGAHTMHHPLLSYVADPAEVRYEVEESRAILERKFGHPVRSFAYPYGRPRDIGERALRAVREAGYDWALTTIPGFNTPQTDPHLLRRMPADTADHWWILAAEATGVWSSLLAFLMRLLGVARDTAAPLYAPLLLQQRSYQWSRLPGWLSSKLRFPLWNRNDAVWLIVSNTGSMVATTGLTSAAGFVFWWIAAHLFAPASVGFGAAAISAAGLLAMISGQGLGTLLIGELPRHPEASKKSSLITTALCVAVTVGGLLGIVTVVVGPNISSGLRPLSENAIEAALFALGVSLSAIGFVLDDAVIGLLEGHLQLRRNALSTATRLCLVGIAGLALAGLGITDGVGLTLFVAFMIGNAVSLVGLAFTAVSRGTRWRNCRPDTTLFRSLGGAAINHEVASLAVNVSALALPVLVASLLSASMTAYFYDAWMIAGFALAIPSALGTTLYGVSAASPDELANRMRFTFKAAMLIGMLAFVALEIGAPYVLQLFGPAYAANGTVVLRILALGVFAHIIRVHYLAIRRIQRRLTRAAIAVILGACLELVLAAVGAHMAGLIGVSIGWAAALYIQAAFMAWPVYSVVTSSKRSGRVQSESWRHEPQT